MDTGSITMSSNVVVVHAVVHVVALITVSIGLVVVLTTLSLRGITTDIIGEKYTITTNRSITETTPTLT